MRAASPVRPAARRRGPSPYGGRLALVALTLGSALALVAGTLPAQAVAPTAAASTAPAATATPAPEPTAPSEDAALPEDAEPAPAPSATASAEPDAGAPTPAPSATPTVPATENLPAPPVAKVPMERDDDRPGAEALPERDKAGDETLDVADPGNVPYPGSGASSGSGDGASGARFELVRPEQSIVPAAIAARFSPGNIISNAMFTNKGAMSETRIRSFIDGKVATCQAGYTCLEEYVETTPTRRADSYCGQYTGGSRESAARIIHKVAQACGINPQVLLVMLQKEQGLLTHTWPSDWRFTIAMGMGCPDTADCDKKYYGFFNQVYGAARQMKIYGSSSYFTWYAPGGTRSIRYHPNASCGASGVYVQNQATSNLYYYTPYQPNAAAIAAGFGTGDRCSSYGNRNFFNYFNAWFGPTGGGTTAGSGTSGGQAPVTVTGAIATRWKALGGASGRLGQPVANQRCGLPDGGCYQNFKGGKIHWSRATGAYATWGAISTAWAASGYERGDLGYPTSGERCGIAGGGCVQSFQGGAIYYTAKTGAHAVSGPVKTLWSGKKAQAGWLGYPTSDQRCGLTAGGCTQNFQGGTVHWSSKSGAHSTRGAIRSAWSGAKWEKGKLGYPVSEERCGLADGGCFQKFQGGTVYYSPTTGARPVWGAVRTLWNAQGAQGGGLGYPTSAERCGLTGGGCFQGFEGGAIHWTPSTGAHSTRGSIRNAWRAAGWEDGKLGYPTSEEACGLAGGGCSQQYQGGRVYWRSGVGAHPVWGAIGRAWTAAGAESGALGYPVTTEKCAAGGACEQRFQHGSIRWAPGAGAVVRRG
jgi:uncharacterized protein with LGFP repeats